MRQRLAEEKLRKRQEAILEHLKRQRDLVRQRQIEKEMEEARLLELERIRIEE